MAHQKTVESYAHAIDEFIGWCSEPRLAFNRTVVLRYRFFLEPIKSRMVAYMEAECAANGQALNFRIRHDPGTILKPTSRAPFRLPDFSVAPKLRRSGILWGAPDKVLMT
jgi:hypothetical protein